MKRPWYLDEFEARRGAAFAAAVDALAQVTAFLAESHEDEVRHRHYGDEGGARTCSYCVALKRARRVVADAQQFLPKVTLREVRS